MQVTRVPAAAFALFGQALHMCEVPGSEKLLETSHQWFTKVLSIIWEKRVTKSNLFQWFPMCGGSKILSFFLKRFSGNEFFQF